MILYGLSIFEERTIPLYKVAILKKSNFLLNIVHPKLIHYYYLLVQLYRNLFLGFLKT